MFIRESKEIVGIIVKKAKWPYKAVKQRLTIDNDVIYKGNFIVPPQTLKTDIIKTVHDGIYCGIMATQEVKTCCTIARVLTWCWIHRKMPEMYRNKNCILDQQKKKQNNVQMVHTYVNGVGLQLSEDSSAYPGVVRVKDRKTNHVKPIFFSGHGVLKMLVTDNALEFCEEN